MALEGANIMGQAQVYNQTQNAVNTYAKTLAQQQARLDKETKLIQDELAKMNAACLRQQDVPGFLEQVQKWRQSATEALTEKNPLKKALAAQNAEREKMLAFAYQQESKDEKKKDEIFYSKGLDPNWRDELQDGAYETLINRRKLSIKDPNFMRDIDELKFVPDVSKFLKKFDDIDSQLFKTGAVVVPGQEQGERMGVQGVYEFDRRILDPQAQSMRYAMEIDTDKNVYKALKEIYPDLAELPKEEFKNKVIPRLIQDRPKEQIGDKKFYDPRAAMNAERRLQLAEQRAADGDGGGNPSNYTVETDTYLYTKPKENDLGEPIAGTDKKSIRMVKSVGFDTDYFPLVDAKVFDVNKQDKDAKVSGNFIVGKLAYVPIDGGGVDLRAVVVNAGGDKYVVKPSVLPIGIRKSKNYNAALKALGSPPPKGKSTVTSNKPDKNTSDSETVKIQLPNGQIGQVPKDKVNAFMKKYPNAKIIK